MLRKRAYKMLGTPTQMVLYIVDYMSAKLAEVKLTTKKMASFFASKATKSAKKVIFADTKNSTLMTTSEFIQQHRMSNPRDLALQSRRHPGVDMPYALDQIQGWQTARLKLPSWAACKDVTYPPHLNMEQCSSEATARYKRDVAQAWAGRMGTGDTSMTDLTGGFGVDFSFVSRAFGKATYVERNASLCDMARHNLPLLGCANATVVCADGVLHLAHCEPQTMIFVDPARRDGNGAKTVLMGDCTPDVCTLLPLLMQKSRFTMLKLSPMLDWHKAVADLGGMVREVHIVSVGGECKELLLILSGHATHGTTGLHVVCADIQPKPTPDGTYAATPFAYDTPCSPGTDAQPTGFDEAELTAATPPYLYEPNASIMKAGCFGELARRYGVRPVSLNSHLFLSGTRAVEFPGREFAVTAATTMNKRQLRTTLAGRTQANIAVRNFPMSVAELRKRLKLRDGGNDYIFATTTRDGAHMLLVAHKIND